MSKKVGRAIYRLSHDEIRPRVCFVCRRKADRQINDEGKTLIHELLCQGVPWDDACIPCGLCRSCNIYLQRWSKLPAGSPRPAEIPPVADFRDVVIFPPQTRAAAQADCECLICKVHYPGGPGKVSPLSAPDVHKKKGGRPKKPRTEEERLDASIQCTPPQPQTMCPTCKLVGAQAGDGHVCNMASLTRNTLALVEQNPLVKERVAASIIKGLPKSPGGTIRLRQATGGQQVPLSLGKAAEPQPSAPITAEVLASLQKARHLPAKGVKEARAIINRAGIASGGKKLVEANVMDKLHVPVELVRPHFIKQKVFIDEEYHEVRHVKDTNAFINDVAKWRGIIRSVSLNRLTNDDGGGCLKLSLSIIDLSADRFKSKEKKKDHIGEYLDSGVRKIFHIAVCDGLKESHEAVAKLLRLCHVKEAMKWAKDNDGGEFCLAPDLKLGNMAVGIGSHSSNHPCCWCNAHKKSLELIGEARTFRRIRELNQRRLLLNKRAKDCDSCKFNPVIGHGSSPIDDRAHDESVIDVIAPGELHILMGVAQLIVDEIELVWSEEGTERWFTTIGIEKRPYRGGTFPGNDCKLMLSKDAIEQLEELTLMDGAYLLVQPHIRTLAALNEVSSKCFSNVLADDWQESIDHFEDCFKELGRAWTPKVHALVFHVPEFIRARGRALGPYSEQPGESLHYLWTAFVTERFSKMPKKKFSDPLLHALVKFNQENI